MPQTAPTSAGTAIRTVLLTGAAGFIGSHVAEALVARGWRVVGLDNFDPFYDPAIKRRHVSEIKAKGGSGSFELVEGDICDAALVRSLFERMRPEGVIHLAAKAGVRPSIADPAGYARANVLGTSVLLEESRRAGVHRFVMASSSSVYGNAVKVPFAETDDVSAPISPYAATKRSCELLAHTHWHLTQMPTACLRFFTVFGPRQRPDLAISMFLGKIAREEQIDVFGDGTSSRDYTFVGGIVQGVLDAYDRIDRHGFRIWNLGHSEPVTLGDMVATIARTVGKPARIVRKPAQPGDVERTYADPTRSAAELDFRPSTPFAEGVARQWAWLRAVEQIGYVMDRTPDAPLQKGRPRRPKGRVMTRIAWSAAAGCLCVSLLWAIPVESYSLDLIANLGAQVLIVCLLGLLLTVVFRRWRAAAVALLAFLIQLTPLLLHRAAFWPRPVEDARTRAPDEVRFLHYNDSSQSDKVSVYELMERSHADIISIIAPPVHMQFDVIYGKGLEDRYAGKMVREWRESPDRVNTETSAGFVVSRWPLRRYDCSSLGPMAEKFLAAIVERPPERGGPFAVVAVHPRSPRNAQRWVEGNGIVEGLATLSREFQEAGLRVVVLTDLNSTPSGWRSRLACSDGHLLRAKPLLDPVGTYPDVVPLNIRTKASTGLPAVWPARIAIDDALVSRGIELIGWQVGTIPPMAGLKSEHDPVLIELRIPRGASSEANRDRR